MHNFISIYVVAYTHIVCVILCMCVCVCVCMYIYCNYLKLFEDKKGAEMKMY